jgi:hypothetical protein
VLGPACFPTSMERDIRFPFKVYRLMKKLIPLGQCLSLSLVLSILASSLVRAQEPLAEAIVVDSKGQDTLKKQATRPLTVSVELTSQAVIAGTLLETEQIQMKTSFGEATIPLSEIAGIRLATPQDTTTTVVMLNGDSITGAVDLKNILVETEWGSAKINGSAILSIMLVPDLKWVNSNSLNGRRWFLVDAKEAAAAAAPRSTPSTTPPAAGANRLPNPSNPNAPVSSAPR